MNYIFFSTFVPLHYFAFARRQLEFYLSLANTAVVVGDNAVSCGRWHRHCAERGLIYSRRATESNINSDAAGFFECLRESASSIKGDDIVWFAHTKGFSTTAQKIDYYFEYYKKNFFSRYSIIEKQFELDASIGLYSDRRSADKYPTLLHSRKVFCDILDAPHAPTIYFAENTFFCVRGFLIRLFMERASALIELDYFRQCGFGRWFFESEFPQIAPAFGYKWIARKTAERNPMAHI